MNAMASVALVALLIGLYGGYEWRDMSAKADEATAIKSALKTQKENNDISRAEEIKLIKSQQKANIVYRSIDKEVSKNVSKKQKSDSGCNVSIGSVRLFERAVTERLPDASAIDAAGDTRPSDVTEERLIKYSLSNIEKYNAVKNQCNALIRSTVKIIKNNESKEN